MEQSLSISESRPQQQITRKEQQLTNQQIRLTIYEILTRQGQDGDQVVPIDAYDWDYERPRYYRTHVHTYPSS